MNLTLSDEQRILGETLDRLIADRHDFDRRRAALASPEGWACEFWQELGALGILAAPLPAQFGGLDGEAASTLPIMYSLGRGLVNAPFVPVILCAAQLLARTGTPAQRDVVARIAGGDRLVTFACAEHGDGGDIDRIRTFAQRGGAGYRINGHKALVANAASADAVVLVARLQENNELGAFLVPLDAAGVTTVSRRTVDGGTAAEIAFRDVSLSEEMRLPHADSGSVAEILDEATVALCIEAAGIAAMLQEATVDFARTRVQFGKPIGKFQVLQHRAVDMLIARDQILAAAYLASNALGASTAERQRAVSAAKYFVGRAGRRLAQDAVQIHGGIGMMDELDVSHAFRRIEVIDMMLGTADDHLARYGALQSREYASA